MQKFITFAYVLYGAMFFLIPISQLLQGNRVSEILATYYLVIPFVYQFFKGEACKMLKNSVPFAPITQSHEEFLDVCPAAERLYRYLLRMAPAGKPQEVFLENIELPYRGKTYTVRHLKNALNELINAGVVEIEREFTKTKYRLIAWHPEGLTWKEFKQTAQAENFKDRKSISSTGNRFPKQETQTPASSSLIQRNLENTTDTDTVVVGKSQGLELSTLQTVYPELTGKVSVDVATSANHAISHPESAVQDETGQTINRGISSNSLDSSQFGQGNSPPRHQDKAQVIGEANQQPDADFFAWAEKQVGFPLNLQNRQAASARFRKSGDKGCRQAVLAAKEYMKISVPRHPPAILTSAFSQGWRPYKSANKIDPEVLQWRDEALSRNLITASLMKKDVFLAILPDGSWRLVHELMEEYPNPKELEPPEPMNNFSSSFQEDYQAPLPNNHPEIQNILMRLHQSPQDVNRGMEPIGKALTS
jgi:hypothetical protein